MIRSAWTHVAGGDNGRVKLLKDMTTDNVTYEGSTGGSYLNYGLWIDLNGCSITDTFRPGVSTWYSGGSVLYLRDDDGGAGAVDSSHGQGKLILDTSKKDGYTSRKVLELSGNSQHSVKWVRDVDLVCDCPNAYPTALLFGGTTLELMDNVNITQNCQAGNTFYAMYSSDVSSRLTQIGKISNCTITTNGIIYRQDFPGAKTNLIENCTFTSTATTGNGFEISGDVTFGEGNIITTDAPTLLAKADRGGGSLYFKADGVYSAAEGGNAFDSNVIFAETPVEGTVAHNNNGTLEFVAGFTLTYMSHDGTKLLWKDSYAVGETPVDNRSLTYPIDHVNQYTFDGWGTAIDGGVIDVTALTADTTLYAQRSLTILDPVVIRTIEGGEPESFAVWDDAADVDSDYTELYCPNAPAIDYYVKNNSANAKMLMSLANCQIEGGSKAINIRGVNGANPVIKLTADKDCTFKNAAGTDPITAKVNNLKLTTVYPSGYEYKALGEGWYGFELIPVWGEPTYVWADDYSTVTATREATNIEGKTETETVSATGTVTKEATCTEAGVTTYTSAAFTNTAFAVQTKEVEIAALGHTLTAHAAAAATCTEAGNSAYWSCETCGKFFSDANGENEITEDSWVIAALGHNLTAHAAVAATCTEAGNSAYWSCETCGKFFSDANGENEITENSWVIAALGHNLTAHAAVAATCTETGNRAYWSCETCGKFFSDANGETEIEENSWVIAALGHNLTAHDAVAATCTEAGNSAYWSCETCGKYYSDANGETEIEANSWITAALGHNMTAHAAVPATCEAAGNSAYWSCETCGKYFSDANGENAIEANSWVLEKLAHTPGEAVRENEIPATCTAEGSYDEVVYCTVCNEELSREAKTIEALGHAYELTGWTWDGFESATATFTCTRNAEHVETVTATGEAITNAVTTEATGSTAGVRTYTATVTFNEKTYTDSKTEEIPALGWDVTFVYGNGTEDAVIHVEHNATIAKPDDPTREGYSFGGWFADGSETAFDFDTPVTGDLTLTAKWDEGIIALHEEENDGGNIIIRSTQTDEANLPAVSIVDAVAGTFDVSFDKGCVVIAYVNGNYQRLRAEEVDGKYRFTATDVEGFAADPDAQIIVAVKGDLDGNGKIDTYEAGWISQYRTGRMSASEIQTIVGDINGNGKLDAFEAGWINQMKTGRMVADWDLKD